MKISYWEHKSWFHSVDFTIIGSGIVGLNCALNLRKKYPKSKILLLEKGLLPSGASTKNAGFACFGSLSEIIDDLKIHTQEEVFHLVKKRTEGLQLLRNLLGDQAINYKEYGGFELFRDPNLFEECLQQADTINQLLKPLFKQKIFNETTHKFGFQNILKRVFFTPFEGQIDTGKMMQALIKKVISKNIQIINGAHVTQFSEANSQVFVQINHNFEFNTKKLFITTNGFSQRLFKADLQPARAQVLITKPIKNLKIKGNFHLDKGYNYFRNIDNRILLGGGRNINFKQETTTRFATTKEIQNHLQQLLSTVILPHQAFDIDMRWSGIMGLGNQKKPIIKALSENIFCGIRLGGMGIAIGSSVGKDLSNFVKI